MAATLVDYIMDQVPKKKQEYRALINVAKAFSATSNTRILLTVADKNNANHYALQFLHGMRFLCIGHIVVCHCGQTISDNWSRYLNMLILSEEWPYMLLSAGFSSVDTFFFQSGFFLCLSVSKQKNNGPFAFVVGLVRRYIRTAIPLFFIIMCLYVLPRLVSGPDTKAFFLELYSGMGRYWLHLILMIRNYADTTALDVLPHVWYLSTDFQLFAISLLMLLLFKRRRMLAIGVFIAVSLLGCAIATWSVGGSVLLPFMAFPAPNLHVMDKTMNDYYVRPYYHAVCYFSGCITYLLMDDFRNRKITKATQIAGWCISLGCGFCCVFMKLPWYRSPTPSTESIKLIAAFFDRILWSAFLMWVTLACSSGRGGLVNKLLSCNVFVAPSKLSFGVYLIHLPFIRLYLQASRERLFWSTFNMASMYFGVLAWSYLLAYFLYLACEAPTAALDKIAFTRIIRGSENASTLENKRHLNGIDVQHGKKTEDGIISRL
ncbi:nose resistant to fluoxetine protein 6-like isoform X1 [Dermacentor andersoni]|uniref:nose resistant to fluoxetine protein 6-like isoform X1 n=1 Tax=Dermacentor andersoni TaxID=34620 RepID=UPI002416DAAD|nr:nose resistant to fluoxetine protein 6-like [Dermacentor andersoni]